MKPKLLLAMLFFNACISYGQLGALDPTFGSGGKVMMGSNFTATAFQPDGKLLGVLSVGGNVLVRRFNVDGSPDLTFGVGGSRTTDLGSASDRAISVDVAPDGKIIVLAHTLASEGGPQSNFLVLLRFNSNGTTDVTFGTAGVMRENIGQTAVRISLSAQAVSVTAAGKIVVPIYLSISSGDGPFYEMRVFQYDANGSKEFVTGTGVSASANFILATHVVQPDGKIVVGGMKETGARDPILPTTRSLLLFRFNSDGSRDASFGTGGEVVSSISENAITIALQDDGKLIVSGAGNILLRLNTNGTPDASFGTGGAIITSYSVVSILVGPANKILTGGSMSGNFAVSRYNSNGTLDAAFGTAGTTTSDFGTDEGIKNMNIYNDRLYAYGNGLLAAYLLPPLAPGNIVSNTVTGSEALASNTTGIFNTAVGHQSLFSNTTGSNNTATGVAALFDNTTGSSNTAYGVHALRSNTVGNQNTGIGVDALFSNTNGSQNTATGTNALRSNISGFFNTAIGNNSLFENATGNNNTVLGYNALRANTNGSNNVAIGYNTASALNASNNTLIGAEASSGNFTNSSALGYQATVTASNMVRIGNTAITSIGGQVGWTNFSDGRFKKNTKEDVPGLEFINKLRPVTYSLDVEGIEARTKGAMLKGLNKDNKPLHSDGKQAIVETTQKSREEKAKIKYTGFIAQEVETAAKKLKYDFSGIDVPKNGEDFYGLRYAEFVVPLVKAVQELDAENDQLKQELTEVKAMLSELMNADKKALSSHTLSGASLGVNIPNPVSSVTTIRYHIPHGAATAQLMITNSKGQSIKSIVVNKGDGQLTLDTGTLAAGTYVYTLWVDGKQVASKQMVVVKH